MPDRVTLESRQLDVIHKADVVVCGGGIAGVAAAVAAAREGAKTMIIEQSGCLGGMATSGLVPCFNPFTDLEKPVVRGFAEEVMLELCRRMNIEPQYDWCPINAEALKRTLDDFIESSGSLCRYYTRIVDVVGREKVEAVVVSTHEGLRAIRAKAFVDATGDGDVSVWAGGEFELGDGSGHMQAPTLCYTFANVDWRAFKARLREDGERPDRYIWEEHFKDGRTPLDEPRLPVGVLPVGKTIGQSNMGHIFGIDCIKEKDLSRGMVAGREMAQLFLKWYRAHVPGFENAEIAATAPMLGVRETRRILGEYVLTVEDYHERASFDDEIGRNANPLDIHASERDHDSMTGACRHEMQSQMPPGESYGIPYGILVPDMLDNVLVAGRCVSTDREMNGSMRVMPAGFVTGQAAGVAASMAAAQGIDMRMVDTDQLREKLRAQGAYLP